MKAAASSDEGVAAAPRGGHRWGEGPTRCSECGGAAHAPGRAFCLGRGEADANLTCPSHVNNLTGLPLGRGEPADARLEPSKHRHSPKHRRRQPQAVGEGGEEPAPPQGLAGEIEGDLAGECPVARGVADTLQQWEGALAGKRRAAVEKRGAELELRAGEGSRPIPPIYGPIAGECPRHRESLGTHSGAGVVRGESGPGGMPDIWAYCVPSDSGGMGRFEANADWGGGRVAQGAADGVATGVPTVATNGVAREEHRPVRLPAVYPPRSRECPVLPRPLQGEQVGPPTPWGGDSGAVEEAPSGPERWCSGTSLLGAGRLATYPGGAPDTAKCTIWEVLRGTERAVQDGRQRNAVQWHGMLRLATGAITILHRLLMANDQAPGS